MRRFLPLLVVLLVLAGVTALFWPQLQQSRRYAALLREPAPTALPNPVPGAALTDTWGAARSGGRKHEGIDIFAKRGTPVRSATTGIVLHVGENPLGGRTVTVLGPAAQRHYYAHLDRYADLQEGQWVMAGDTLGYVGNSGNATSTPPHLHYGIYTARGAINPYPLLKAGAAP
ncbi:M23 family metallopeptidase [Deinococcus lacus]|uniref:M23 family metallopeptidase n=1 Tax=Deinococcus lacus TaxID=392561 RepID=A0ABW1YD39_9DEIO